MGNIALTIKTLDFNLKSRPGISMKNVIWQYLYKKNSHSTPFIKQKVMIMVKFWYHTII